MNEYIEVLRYYPFASKLDQCFESFNTLNDLSNKVWVQNKTEDLNLSAFSMITGIHESKILIKHVSCEYEYQSDDSECNSNQKWNTDKCRRECKNL